MTFQNVQKQGIMAILSALFFSMRSLGRGFKSKVVGSSLTDRAALREFFKRKIEEWKARERELAKLDENRRA